MSESSECVLVRLLDTGDSEHCARCQLNGLESKPEDLVNRYCPYCNKLVRVCQAHARTYTPHKKRDCALPGYPYPKTARLRAKRDPLLREVMHQTIAEYLSHLTH